MGEKLVEILKRVFKNYGQETLILAIIRSSRAQHALVYLSHRQMTNSFYAGVTLVNKPL